MTLPTRQMLLGISLGALCATALAMAGPGMVLEAFADELPAGFDTGKLVKFDDRDYEVSYDDWVSTDPLSTATVKKVEAGRVSYVSISTTATGTYSTDGLTSRHVRYPGIAVREVLPDGANRFAYWSNGHWQSFAVRNGNSFVMISNPVRN